MGIQDRDYMRRECSDSSGQPIPGSSRYGIVRGLAVFALVVGGLFVLSTFHRGTKPKRITGIPAPFDQPAPTPFRPVNINTATADELDAIPHVGPALAGTIIAHRPYATLEELTKVPGIKERTLERIRPYVTLK